MNKNHCHANKHTEYSSLDMSHGSARDFLKRFWFVTFLLLPLVFTNETVVEFLNLPSFEISKWISFSIATIIFSFAFVFFQHAWMEIKAKSYGMMTLVSLAVLSSYLFSVFSTFIPTLETEFYLEISSLIWVLLFGHYLEAKSSSVAGDALQEVAKLLPKQAHLLKDGKEINTDITELKENDIVLVKPGEKVPADGIILKGSGNVDEAHISGESKPVLKNKSDVAVAGSIVLDTAFTIELTHVGEHSTIGQIKNLISEAQKTKPSSQKIADKVAGILTFVAGTVAIATLLVWTLFIGQSFVFAMTLAITVLVIACPHALGLAIPTVTTITTKLAIKNGFFIKDLAKIETIRKTDYVVFDKTGTLTEGKFKVNEIISFGNKSKNEILTIAASLEQHSSHVIGTSILDEAKKQNLNLKKISNFQNIAGEYVVAEIAGKKYFVGKTPKADLKDFESLKVGTKVFVSDEKESFGVIILSDKIKNDAKVAVEKLHKLGIKTAMLTGDNETVAKSVANELGIDKYFANVLPEDKYKHIKGLQKDGSIVLMIGDGVNDAPALTQADAGVAIGVGTDVAVESGDVVLMRNSPSDVPRLIKLSKKVYKKMTQNLIWAFGYNIVAIPIAAGVFAFAGFYLRPEIGALVMSLSTVIVVVNALTLKRVQLE